MSKDNELIAEFMGLTLKKKINGINYYNVPAGHIESHNASMGDFAYHRRWDWIMPVVYKIASFRMAYPEETSKVCDCKVVIDRIVLYAKVIDFIKWYNKNENPTYKNKPL